MMKIKCFVVFLFITIAISSLANAAPGRRFYLTKHSVDGSGALQACVPGFHMASLWEIYDVSNVRYDRVLGFTLTDSGFGPPAGAFGWVRTGTHPDVSTTGIANCNVWTSNNPGFEGTLIELPIDWENIDLGNPIGSWHAGTGDCAAEAQVWCVQN